MDIKVKYEENKQSVPIKYFYRLPQYKNLEVLIPVGQLEYKVRKELESKSV